MATLGVTREHWIQSFTNIGVLMLSCGGMLVGATYFTVGHIDAVEASDTAARLQQSQAFNKLLSDQGTLLQTEIRAIQDLQQKTENQMDHRVTIIEEKDESYKNVLNDFNVKLSQIQAAETDLATALAKMSAIEEERNGDGKKR